MKVHRGPITLGVVLLALTTAAPAGAVSPVICSPAWGSGSIPQICITVPLSAQEHAPPFGAEHPARNR